MSVDLFEMVAKRTRLCKLSDKLIANFKALQQQALANSPILAFPDFDRPFEIQGDASAVGRRRRMLTGK